MVVKYFQEALIKFINSQASGGILLLIMTLLAIIFANSQLHVIYHHFLETYLSVKVGSFGLKLSVEHFINDALMAIFFFMVSLEMKREIVEGQLSTREQQILPVIAAVGGVIVPALFYVAFNHDNILASGDSAVQGWAIPAATDIAFALGIISLFGSRVPIALKAFLTALAIIDDLAAIIIIALFYSNDMSLANLLFAAIIMVVLMTLNRNGVVRKSPYILLGLLMWLFILESGVHATIAGVLLGLTIPLKHPKNAKKSPLKEIEHGLHPWVAYFILPIFAFANAGINFDGINLDSFLADKIALGIASGLFIGKQIGVFGLAYILIKTGIAAMPHKANWKSLYGTCVLTGIGFTMSIFVGNLAFPGNAEVINNARVGILFGSFASAVLGYLILHFSCPKK